MEEKETVDCSQSLGVIGYGKRRNYSIILIDPNQICRTNEREYLPVERKQRIRMMPLLMISWRQIEIHLITPFYQQDKNINSPSFRHTLLLV